MPVSRLAFAAALLLAACSGKGGGQAADDAGNVTADAPAGITNARVGVPADFNVLDACSLLDRRIVAEVMGSPVKLATLGDMVTAPTDATAGFSNCTYTLENGLTPQFFARWSPEPDTADPATVAKEAAEVMSSKAEAVPGMKEPVFWVEGPGQLHIFPDKQKYLFFTMMFMAPNSMKRVHEAEAKGWAIAMAKRAGY